LAASGKTGGTMRTTIGLAIAFLLATATNPAAGKNGTREETMRAPQGTFPELTAKNLQEKTLSLPGDFAGERNLLLIAFKRKQQQNVDTWLREMKRFESFPDFHYYELPTISKLNPIARWFINRGMRSGIPDSEARARTITLYLDKEKFKNALNLPDENRIYAILVDRKGQVHWRTDGDFDEAKAASLQRALSRAAQFDQPPGM
jgi:hypothetical protein